METTLFLIAAVVAILFLLLMLFLALFEPGLPYTIAEPPPVPLDSDEFFRILGALGHAQIHHATRVEVLNNGEVYYEAELQAIREARESVNIEAYIFNRGRVTRRFLDLLTEKARAGVHVNVVLDAVGSFTTWASYLKDLANAGGRVFWYHPIRWYTLPRINNRTHRELIVVDGRVGFIGGAGFADWWLLGRRGKNRWRDTMFRVEGAVVRDLQATFVENWVESSGEILAGKEYFPESHGRGSARAMVVGSSPTTGLSTRARMLFQTLIACAQKSICITTPYFLPDRSARQELVQAIRDRGVEVRILTPGRHTDQLLTRRSSRRLYGPLLEAGARIFEYRPAMIHVKTLIVDELWSVVGSTNFDNRSFGLNDEVNLAACDGELAARLLRDFARDLADSRSVSYPEWRRRPILERGQEWVGWLLERQQ
jgi:cardiolipin synthase A/B